MTTILAARGLSVTFGAVHALADVNLEVGDGQLVGLIGPNGAGKTTFIDAVTGFVTANGTVTLAERDVSMLASHDRARLGLARTWQTIELFDDLSVAENLAVSSRRSTLAGAFLESVAGRRPRSSQPADDALRLLGLASDASRMPSELPQGHRKLVGIARALSTRPRLLLLDEPAAGLDSSESRELGQRLRSVVDSGLPTLLVDHDMNLVLGICDYIYVLDFGRVIAHGTPAEIRHDPRVLAAYLGGSVAEAAAIEAKSEAQAAGPATPSA